jgi:hypothetical protein
VSPLLRTLLVTGVAGALGVQALHARRNRGATTDEAAARLR